MNDCRHVTHDATVDELGDRVCFCDFARRRIGQISEDFGTHVLFVQRDLDARRIIVRGSFPLYTLRSQKLLVDSVDFAPEVLDHRRQEMTNPLVLLDESFLLRLLCGQGKRF